MRKAEISRETKETKISLSLDLDGTGEGCIETGIGFFNHMLELLKKVAQVVLGLEVPHAHIHLIPMQNEGDVNFRREKLKLSEEEFKEIAAKIYEAFKKQ